MYFLIRTILGTLIQEREESQEDGKHPLHEAISNLGGATVYLDLEPVKRVQTIKTLSPIGSTEHSRRQKYEKMRKIVTMLMHRILASKVNKYRRLA